MKSIVGKTTHYDLELTGGKINVFLNGEGGGGVSSTFVAFAEVDKPHDDEKPDYVVRLQEYEDEVRSICEWNMKIDVIESLVLAHALSGVDIESKKYIEGLNQTLQELANRE